MTTVENFTTACMKYEIHPGFVAEKVQQAGHIIEGLGSTLVWVGDLCIQYGYSGGTLSALTLGGGTLVEWNGKRSDITPFATQRLKETGGALAVGAGLVSIGKPVTYLGNLMQTRETQCKIGEGLIFPKKLHTATVQKE